MKIKMNLVLVTKLLIALTLLVSFSVLYGWMTHDISFIKLGPRLPPMVFNTAFFFSLFSLNLILDRKKFYWPLTVLNALLAVFSFLTIIEYAFAVNFGIDQFFFKDTIRLDLTHPGRMGPNTAFGFIVLAVAFFFKPNKYTKFRIHNTFPLILFTFSILIGVMSLFGFIFSAERGYIWGAFTRLALQTGLCFLFFGTAALLDNLRSLNYLKSIEQKTKRLIASVITSVIGSTILLWFIFCSLDAHKLSEIVESEDSHVEWLITQSLENRLEGLERVGVRLESNKLTTKIWELEARLILKHFDGLESLIIFDQGLNVRSVFNDVNFKLNLEKYFKTTQLSSLVDRAKESKQSQYSEVFLDEFNRGVFFAAVPLYKDSQFDGTLVGLFSSDLFFRPLLSTSDHLIKIYSNDIILYTNITPETPVISEWQYESEVSYSDLSFVTNITPAKKIISSQLGVTPTIILFVGVFLSIFLAAFVASINELHIEQKRSNYISQWQRAILNGTDLGLVSTDIEGNIILVNPAAEKLLGRKEEEIIGKITPDVWHDIDEVKMRSLELSRELGVTVEPGMNTFFAKSLHGLPDKWKWTVYRKSGEARKINLSVHILRSTDGEVNGFLGVMEDITDLERQQLIYEDQRAKMIASSKMSSLGEMAAGIAHEINNPLTVIKGMAKLIRLSSEGQALDKGFVVESSDKIEETVDRIAKIIRSLKSFARDSSHEEMSVVNIAKILDDTIPFCSERFKSSVIDIRLDIEDVKIKCRPVQISQVLLNLLNNAYDAIVNTENKWVELTIRKKQDVVQICVVDSGKGISLETATKIMQPFFTTKEIGKGTGLGLSISAGIIESHNGRLYYDNNSSNTKFVIELPAVKV